MIGKKGSISRLGLVVFIILFWLILPFVFMSFGVNDINIPEINTEQGEPSAFQQLTYFFDLAKVYFQLLTFSFPEINWFVGRFLNIIQILTIIGGLALLKL